ncbi:MAG: hypothetical protein EOP04_28165, partial [Proteobacteria bacterium]
MNGLNSKVLMVLVALMGLPLKASDIVETNKYMLDMVSTGISSSTLMRIKIFPHDKDYKPQGLDPHRDQLSIESEGECQASPAAADKVQATGPVQTKFNKQQFEAATLKGPVLIRCAQPFTLVRSGVPLTNSFTYSGSVYLRAVDGALEADRALARAI